MITLDSAYRALVQCLAQWVPGKCVCSFTHQQCISSACFVPGSSPDPGTRQRTNRQIKVSAVLELTFTCTGGNCYYFEVFTMFWESIEMAIWSHSSGRVKTSERQSHTRGTSNTIRQPMWGPWADLEWGNAQTGLPTLAGQRGLGSPQGVMGGWGWVVTIDFSTPYQLCGCGQVP